MCGIVGFTGKSNALPFLLDGLERLEYRGYDSAGIAVFEDRGFKLFKTVSRIKTLKTNTQNGADSNSRAGIGHTRWATHGEPSLENAHPHLSSDCKFAVVHNGIIENFASLKAELISDGFQFKSQTDTEVVPFLLQKYYKGNLKECISAVTNRLEGSYALGIICEDYPELLVAVKQFSPLIIGLGEGFNAIASDVTAVVSHTKNVVYLEDGQTAFITPCSIEIQDTYGNKIRPVKSVITWDVSAAQKDGYSHFMMKEIKEQPTAVAKTLESRIFGREIVFEGLKLDTEKLKKIKRIQIIACGSAYHAGIVGKYVFEELLRIPVEVDLASEYRYRNPIADSSTLAIIISQSGETADTLAALREAKKHGAHLLSIVNVVGSSIAKASHDVIYTYAGPEIAVATTKGYSTQLSVIYLLAIWSARRLKINTERAERLFDELLKLPQKITEVLKTESRIKELANRTETPKSLFFIGRNIDYAVALEASLKLKEISYIHSEAYAAGELKHGTISLLEKGKTVIALCGYTELAGKMQSNIKEVTARGAKVLACVPERLTNNFKGFELIPLPETDPLALASVEIIPFQLFAYYTALKCGCDIDKPRNLAKSVTVE